MRVVVDLCSISYATLKMNGQDVVADVKQFISQIAEVPVDDIHLEYHSFADRKNYEAVNDTMLETLTDENDKLALYLKRTTPEVFNQVEKLRLEQDKIKNEDIFGKIVADDVMMTRYGAYIISQGLVDELVPKAGDGYVCLPPPSVGALSSSEPAPEEPVEETSLEVAQLKLQIDGMTIEELNDLIADREFQLKLIKKQLALRKKEKKGEDITINLLQPSGRTVPQVVKPKNTILQVKRVIVEALNMDKPETIRLVYGTDEMRNTKTIAGYGIGDGDVVTMVLALAGGAKRGVVQQTFIKTAKRMQATQLIQRTQNTTDQAIAHCNQVSNQLMALADTDARGAMRALLVNNADAKLDECIAVMKTTNNKDSRLEQWADILFQQVTQPVQDRISELNGAIETTHCVFQQLGFQCVARKPRLGKFVTKKPRAGEVCH
eukprot:Skav214638  [mRNA]  locus=scaffold1009:135110:136414:+ [translate_table: standard]